MVTRGGTPGAFKKRKKKRLEDIKRAKRPGERAFRKPGRVSKKDRLELATARARRAGIPDPKLKDGEVVSKTREEARAEEIKNIAQKGIDIETEKTDIKIEQFREEQERVELAEEEERLASFQRPITEEEIAAGLTQEDIEKGLTISAVGTAMPVTTTDIMTVLTVAGGIKSLITKAIGKAALKAAIKSGNNQQLIGQLTHSSSRLATYVPKPGGFTRIFTKRAVANNAKTYGLQLSYLQKLAATTKDPRFHLAILGTVLYTSLFWAPNEKGDALTTLSIIQRDAMKDGDVEAVMEIDDLIQEALNISAGIPVMGFLKSEIAKFKAVAKASEVLTARAEKLRK